MPTPNVLYYGSEAPLAAQIPLRAGPLSLLFEDGDLRRIRLGEREVIRRWYSAVRDYNWLTIRNQLSNVQIDSKDDRFEIRYDVVNREREVDFVWRGTITGDAGGTITFTLDGVARSTFRKNRIGFCVLHPLDCAGTACKLTDERGLVTETQFPLLISPHQPFINLSAMAHEVVPGVWAALAFEGDNFETEDQRNWTDASYKTYCTPLGLPFPVTIHEGERVWQRVTLSLQGDIPQNSGVDESDIAISIDHATLIPLPPSGLGASSSDQPLTPREVARLQALSLDHLRVELRLAESDHEATFRRAIDEAHQLGVGLEIAVFVPETPGKLEDFARLLNELRPPVASWVVFNERGLATRPQAIEAISAILRACAPAAPIGGGTNANFTELNRMRPLVEPLDFVCFSAQPQEHASDVRSIAETPQALHDVIASAQAIAGEKPVAVTPITLHRRLNPYATAPELPPAPGELPPRVDPRQISLFGAGWTVAYLKYIVEAGNLHHLTLFETVGWRGVLETEAGSPLPDKFPSIPASVFPLYHVLADIGAFAGGTVVKSYSSRPLRVECLALRRNDVIRILLANLTELAQTVQLNGVTGTTTLWLLDESNALDAMTGPEAFRARPAVPVDGATVHLRPYAVARIDAHD